MRSQRLKSKDNNENAVLIASDPTKIINYR